MFVVGSARPNIWSLLFCSSLANCHSPGADTGFPGRSGKLSVLPGGFTLFTPAAGAVVVVVAVGVAVVEASADDRSEKGVRR